MMSPPRLVIFDLDGTLVDSGARIVEIMTASIKAHECVVPPAGLMRSGIGLPLVKMYQRVLPHISPAACQSMADFQTELGRRGRESGEAPDPAFPGARAALEDLDRAGHLLAVSTSKSRAGADYVLKGHGYDTFFAHVRCPDEGHAKPHPDAVHDILAKTGVEPRHTVLVGDTETDMMTAANAGVVALGVGWGYHEGHRLRDAGAAAIAEAFAEVPMLVRDMLVRELIGV